MSAVEQVFGTGLKHRISVFVPGTTSVDQPMTATEHKAHVRTALRTLSVLFGGATAQSATGGWVNSQGNLVVETVTEVYSYTSELSIPQLRAVRQLALSLARECGQEAITVTVDGEMFFLT